MPSSKSRSRTTSTSTADGSTVPTADRGSATKMAKLSTATIAWLKDSEPNTSSIARLSARIEYHSHRLGYALAGLGLGLLLAGTFQAEWAACAVGGLFGGVLVPFCDGPVSLRRLLWLCFAAGAGLALLIYGAAHV